jgi:exopolyphosphatase / guanosine-5'-triphosphate,3'-diphosphate pyrophosphatase
MSADSPATTTTTASRRRKTDQPAEGSLRLAAIDVGTNSVHMIVAQADNDGGVTTLWRMKEMVGLGRISFPSRKLTAEAIQRAVTTLDRFRQAAQQRGAEKIIAIATSAVREASNGGDLIERVRRELKMYIKVVSAKDEARLIYMGVRHATDLGEAPHLLIDIGGGSVELIVGDSLGAALLESRKLGAARMTAKFVKSDPLSKDDRRAMMTHYRRELSDVVERIRDLGVVKVIGTSGTLENIAAMCGDRDEDGKPIITRKSFDRVRKQLVASDAAERESIGGLNDTRKEQIVAAAVLVGYLMDELDIKKIHLCDSALREGILVEYIGRHKPDLQVRRDVPDPRRRAVLDLARRCHWHQTHSEQVARLTMRLYKELAGVHDMDDHERELIEYAALLHDIGWHIGPRGHHKHSQYLIVNSGDLDKLFTAEEIAVIGLIARHHRKDPPIATTDKDYAALSRKSRRVVDVGSALLRIADGLDRSHGSVVKDLKCRIGETVISLRLDVRSDAELEIWGARRKAPWFEKVFGKALELAVKE